MEHEVQYLTTGYLAVMSLLGFLVMGIDKRKAVKRAFRIPEKTLLLIAFIGGGIGSFIGMYFFRHKTKHAKFVISLPISAVLYLVVMLKLYTVI